MTKYGLLCAGAALALGAPAFAQAQTIRLETVPPTIAAPADTLSPPSTTVLVAPTAPSGAPIVAPSERWVPGRYAWDAASEEYVWLPGHHVEAPAEAAASWVPGYYAPTDGGFVWVEGHWR